MYVEKFLVPKVLKEATGEGRGAKLLQIYRPSDEAGPRGAFASKNPNCKCSCSFQTEANWIYYKEIQKYNKSVNLFD